MNEFNKPTNPQAFPKTPFIELGTPQNGMTLRDYFAAAALQGMLSEPSLRAKPQEFASKSYELADAMLKAREE